MEHVERPLAGPDSVQARVIQHPVDQPIDGPSDQLVVWPHRSLGRRGTAILLGFVALVFSAISVWALRTGAWPMLLYAALALAGFSWAVYSNNRVARLAQVIEFMPGKIRVCEIGPASTSRQAEEFNPHWVRVVEAPGPTRQKRLLLRQSGRSVAIGDFLSPEERVQLAHELRERIAQRYWVGQSQHSGS